MKLLKHMSELYDEELDRRSQELFDKNFIQLALGEQEKVHQYIHDISNPKWAPIIINNIKTGNEVSNTGLVKGISGKILKPFMTNSGYYMVNVTIDLGIQYNMNIHRLVAIAFIPNPELKPTVNHINGKKICNWVGNLEWATYKENMEHAVRTGLLDIKGEKHPKHVYSEKQIREVCRLLQDTIYTPTVISSITGVSRDMIFRIREGSTWTHVSKEYNIPDVDFCKKADIEDIKLACQLLENENNSYEYIMMLTGIKRMTLTDIVRGHSYKSISKNYKLKKNRIGYGENHPMSKSTEQDIHKVCQLLTDPNNSYEYISKQTGVSEAMIGYIFKGKNWTHISKMYKIPKNRTPERHYDRRPKAQFIIKCINDGLTNDQIVEKLKTEFDMPDRTKSLATIYRIKTELKNQ